MRQLEFWQIMLIGFALVIAGFVVPFLMTIKVVEPSFLLSFLSYGASVSGLLIGLVGASWYVHKKRKGPPS